MFFRDSTPPIVANIERKNNTSQVFGEISFKKKLNICERGFREGKKEVISFKNKVYVLKIVPGH